VVSLVLKLAFINATCIRYTAAAKGVMDFAGGIVVHITAGIGALVGAAVLGPRKENRMVAGNLVLTVLGTGMLWVGLDTTTFHITLFCLQTKHRAIDDSRHVPCTGL
jgi:ammonia channel protein AmtB